MEKLKDIGYYTIYSNSIIKDNTQIGKKLFELQHPHNCVTNHTILAHHFFNSSYAKDKIRQYEFLKDYKDREEHPIKTTFKYRLNEIDTNVAKNGLSKETLLPYKDLLWDITDFWGIIDPYYRFDQVKLLNKDEFKTNLNGLKYIIQNFKGQSFDAPISFNKAVAVIWGCFESGNLNEAEILATELYKIVVEVKNKNLTVNNFGDQIKNTPRIKMSVLILLLSIYNSKKDTVNFTKYFKEIRQLDSTVSPSRYNIDYIIGVNRLVEHNLMNYELIPNDENKKIVLESFYNHTQPIFCLKHGQDISEVQPHWLHNDGFEGVLEKCLVANRVSQLFFE